MHHLAFDSELLPFRQNRPALGPLFRLPSECNGEIREPCAGNPHYVCVQGATPPLRYADSPLERPVAERRDATPHHACDSESLPDRQNRPALGPVLR